MSEQEKQFSDFCVDKQKVALAIELIDNALLEAQASIGQIRLDLQTTKLPSVQARLENLQTKLQDLGKKDVPAALVQVKAIQKLRRALVSAGGAA